MHVKTFHVRFGSKADIRTAKSHVRFTPESDIRSANTDVRFGPKADVHTPVCGALINC